MANEKIIKQKEEQVKVLAEEFKNSGLIMLVDYRGINVADDTELRRAVRQANGKYSIIKNNIVRRALQSNGYEVEEDKVEGPTAVITTTEEYLPVLKAIYNLLGNAKDIEKVHVDDIVKMCENNVGGKFLTPNKHVKVSVQNKKIYFERM